jgi:WhiB family redox-sensing transcriptional regulator
MEQLCAQTDPEIFFPEHSWGYQLAKEICGRCISVDVCRDDAIASNFDDYGVQGGLSPKERRKARRAL